MCNRGKQNCHSYAARRLGAGALYFNTIVRHGILRMDRNPALAVKPIFLFALAGALLCGCATSTIESRKKERYSAFSELSAEQRAAVDAGQIKVGMPKDAVYIAWGKPHQVLVSESSAGTQEVWIYLGTYLQSYNYWGFRPYFGPYRYY